MGIFHGMIEGYKTNTVWPIRRQIFEINITNSCNLNCPNCQACVGVAPDNSHIPMSAITAFIEDSISIGCMWEVIKLTGGEALLHPNINQIISEIKKYVDHNKKIIKRSGLYIKSCDVRILTNGSLDTSQLPKWITIQNQSSIDTKVWNKFESFNVAPIDVPSYQNIDPRVFCQGCMRVCKCGGGSLGTDGLYYPCVVGYQVARIFMIHIGLPNLQSFVSAPEHKLRNILKKTCCYCGYFKYPRQLASSQKTSQTWSTAISNYKSSKIHLQ